MSWLRQVYFNIYYFFDPPWDTGVSPPELFEFMEQHSPGRALDLGCGTGTNVITLAQHGWEVTGIDFANHAIRVAKRKAQEAGVTVDLHTGDVTKLEEFTEQFDFVLDIGCFHSLKPESQVTYINILQRLLAPGGHFLVYGFFRGSNSKGPGMLESTLNKFEDCFDQVNREDGVNRFQRPSVWLTYQRKLAGSQELNSE
jgi:ubiquinone/menaquinone biosynthesis C-methylase UbiE